MTVIAKSKKTNAATSSYYNSAVLSLWLHHQQAAKLSFKRIMQHPLASLLTVAVIGIAIALPTLLILLLQNARTLSDNWHGGAQISVYLSMNANDQRAEQIMTLLKERYGLKQISYTSPAKGLTDFEKNTGITHILDQLQTNPLPGVIDIVPNQLQDDPNAFASLVAAIEQFPGVDSVQVDLAWVKRLANMISVAKRFVIALGILLGLSVLLVVGNTIRLSTQNRKEEITVAKLIGAADPFIRRPFLYAGIFYGLFGAVLAWLVVIGVLYWLQSPIQSLSQSYGSQFTLANLSISETGLVWLVGASLGFIGAWIAVTLCLNNIEIS